MKTRGSRPGHAPGIYLTGGHNDLPILDAKELCKMPASLRFTPNDAFPGPSPNPSPNLSADSGSSVSQYHLSPLEHHSHSLPVLFPCCFVPVSPPLSEGMWDGLSVASQTRPYTENCYSLGCYSVALDCQPAFSAAQ